MKLTNIILFFVGGEQFFTNYQLVNMPSDPVVLSVATIFFPFKLFKSLTFNVGSTSNCWEKTCKSIKLDSFKISSDVIWLVLNEPTTTIIELTMGTWNLSQDGWQLNTFKIVSILIHPEWYWISLGLRVTKQM